LGFCLEIHHVAEENYCVSQFLPMNIVNTSRNDQIIEQKSKKNESKTSTKNEHFVFLIHKSPGAMLVTAEHSRNDV
jgi:hypothetical protein